MSVINQERLVRLAKLLRKPRAVGELAGVLECSRRTVYRYLWLLSEQGHEVEVSGITRPTHYRIRK